MRASISLETRFKDILEKKKSAILKRWFTVIAESYPEETAKFLRSQRDPFANPVGRTIHKSTEDLFDELLTGPDHKNASAYLDPIIRIRAIQNFTPSSATEFIFSLKSVVRDVLRKDIHEPRLEQEMVDFEARIDKLGLMAFDVYMKCKEKIYEIKANEFRNRFYSAFRRAGLISEVPGEPDLD